MNRAIRRMTLTLALSLAVAPLWAEEAGHGEAAPAADAPPRPVVSEVMQPELASARSFVGVVVAKTETQLAFSVPGTLAENRMRLGAVVARGDVLGQLDPTDFDAALRSAEAGVKGAEAQLAQARDAEARAIQLLSRGAGTDVARENATRSRIAAEAQLEQAKSQRDRAADRRGLTRLIAPVDGVILSVPVEQGEVLQAGQPVAVLAATEGREVRIDLTEAELASIPEGARFEVQLLVDGGVVTRAALGRIAPVATKETRTRETRLVLEKASAGFRLGALVSVRLVGGSQLMTLPLQALAGREGEAGQVWVVARPEGRVSARQVTLGAEVQSRIVVRAGLEPGEEVIIRGVNSLSEGQIVGPQVAK